MGNVKIETLTPVHIGSGNLLQNNIDFVIERKDGDSFIYKIDDRKVLNLIGVENIDKWIAMIEKKEPAFNFFKQHSSYSSYKDFSNQRVTCFANNIKPNDTIKEIVYNGMGLPYIPGSSIKGAIRTSILAALTKNMKDLDDIIFLKNRFGQFVTNRMGNNIVSGEAIEKELFGNNPNSDIFRFIRVGDAYFDNQSVIATKMINLNIRVNKDSLWDESKPQIIEAIAEEEHTNIEINIAREYYRKVKSEFRDLGHMPSEIQSLDSMFLLINEHTRSLVQTEIDYWSEISKDKEHGEAYIELMEKLLKIIDNCDRGKSCVLRVGHASGWRFITGAWTESLNSFNQVIDSSRPNNNRYMNYDFPKSRRIDDYGDAMGFVKLTIS